MAVYHTISNIDKKVTLQQYIDNRDSNKRIGLKSFTYALGWYNIVDEDIHKTGQKSYQIQNGYYSFQQIADEFNNVNITLSVNENNGIASLFTDTELKLSKNLKKMLGFSNIKRKFQDNVTHVGNNCVDFATIKSIYLHLEQLNTSQNYFNGTQSTVLAVVSIENKIFGDIISVRFEHPEFKRLSNGTITELKITARDENGVNINNHGLPMSAVLEIV